MKVSFNLTIVNILKMRDDVYTVLQAHGLAKFIVRKLNVAYFESKHKGIPCTLNVNIKQLLFYFLYKQYICTLNGGRWNLCLEDYIYLTYYIVPF